MTEHTKQKNAFLNEKFLFALYRLIQTVKLHNDNNDLTKLFCSAFFDALKNVFQGDTLTINVAQQKLYIQKEMLQEKKSVRLIAQEFINFLALRRLSGFIFHSDIIQVSSPDLLHFIRLLLVSANYENPCHWLLQKIKEEAIFWVEPQQMSETEYNCGLKQTKEVALATYVQAQISLKEIAKSLSSGRQVGIRRIKRLMHNLVDYSQNNEGILIGLSSIRDYDDYTYTHSINVSLLAICMGKRIGLTGVLLLELGICGFFHDLGKVQIAQEIIKKKEALTAQEREEINKHPLWSMMQILKLNVHSELKLKIILAPFEHHLNYDMSGYPQTRVKSRISLFGRILRIADYYDAITSPRVYRTSAYTADQALQQMLLGSGKEFDPQLLTVFCSLIKEYPEQIY